jgi:hypothetical protein
MRRSRPVAASLVALTAGLAASAVLRRLAARRRHPRIAAPSAPAAAPAPAVPVVSEAPPAPAGRDAVVLTFARRATPEAAPVARPAAPARCGDSGGRTKAGAPCGARAANGGRCHHHPIAA